MPLEDGKSGVHTHMTNSLNTPVEALDTPIRSESGDTACGANPAAGECTEEATASSGKSNC